MRRWVATGLIVKVMHADLAGGKYFKKKGRVVAVDEYAATVLMDLDNAKAPREPWGLGLLALQVGLELQFGRLLGAGLERRCFVADFGSYSESAGMLETARRV